MSPDLSWQFSILQESKSEDVKPRALWCDSKRLIFSKKLCSTTQLPSLISTSIQNPELGQKGERNSKKSRGLKITSKGTVMWIKASDNSKEAFFHVSASKQIVVPVSFLIPLLNFAVMIIIIYKSSRIVHKIYAKRRQNLNHFSQLLSIFSTNFHQNLNY